MTKQEEIREGILESIIQHDPRTCLKVYNRVLSQAEIEAAYDSEGKVITEWGKIVDQILKKLHSQDVGIKVGEISDDLAQTASEAPRYLARGKDMALISTERTFHIFKSFKDMDYVATEPLIEEILKEKGG